MSDFIKITHYNGVINIVKKSNINKIRSDPDDGITIDTDGVDYRRIETPFEEIWEMLK